MTDRELLELEDAARAAGYSHTRLTDDGTALLLYGVQQPWNPRDENPHSDCMGDALWLAVKLRMRVYNDGSCAHVELSTGEKYCWAEAAVVEGNDHSAATRLAIVRAAAEIGKAMK